MNRHFQYLNNISIKYIISKSETVLHLFTCAYCYSSQTTTEQWRVDKIQILKFVGITVKKEFLRGNYVCSKICAKLLKGKLKRIG